MNAERDQLVKDIYADALEKASAVERAAFLGQACGADARLRHDVETLLQAYEKAAGFLEEPALVPADNNPVLSTTLTNKPGDRIGHYRLVREIGEGGFGVVYVAEQEEPVRRRVALKLIKPGMDTRAVIGRFEAERQALALMDHPNIAKVFDAGATETGRPYFVMELVRGVRITDYCDQHCLSTKERLELFLPVCHAIQHAHQKGIIHRDLKPSNILVTLQDSVPVPKVIDFGIAKATGGQVLTDKTVYTALDQFLGTPAYTSPEQAQAGGVDIDTRSDVYNLGVVLYELLTGHTPFEHKRLVEAGLDEIRRIIREEEPARPSTRLSTLAVEEQTTVAKRRHAGSPELIHLLRDDLDWIAMKCLEKDRNRRYETANALAMDLVRHLKHEPVVAQPPSNVYRIQKYARRHRLGLAAAGAVFVALVVGLAIATWGFLTERTARKESEVARVQEAFAQRRAYAGETIRQAKQLYLEHKFDEAERLLDSIPADMIQPDSMHASLRRNLAWWHSIRDEWQGAAANLTVLMSVNEMEDWNILTLDYLHFGAALVQAGDTNGYENFRRSIIPRFSRTTNSVLAERICKISLLLPADAGFMTQLDAFYGVATRGQDHPQANADLKAWAAMSLAVVDLRRGHYTQALKWCQVSSNTAAGKPDRSAAVHAIRAIIHHNAREDAEAEAALNAGRTAEADCYVPAPALPDESPLTLAVLYDGTYARILLREATTLITGIAPTNSGFAPSQYSLGNMYANAEGVGKDLEKAAEWYRRAADQGYALAQNQLASMYWSGRGVPQDSAQALVLYRKAAEQGLAGAANKEALKLREDVLPLTKAKFGADHPRTLSAMHDLASAYYQAGHWREAIDLFEQTVPLMKNKLGPDDLETLNAMFGLAASYRDTGRYEEAGKVFGETVALLKAKLGPDGRDTLNAMIGLASSQREAGRPEEAIKLFEQMISLMEAKLGPDDRDTLSAMHELGSSYEWAGQWEQAVEKLERTLKLSKTKLGIEHESTLSTMGVLAVCYYETGRKEDALRLCEQRLQVSKTILGPDHPRTLNAMKSLAFSYYDTGRSAEALALGEQTLQLMRVKWGAEHPQTLGAMRDLALYYLHADRRDDGIKLLEQTLQLRLTRLPAGSPDILRTMKDLAKACRDAGRQEDAQKLLGRTLAFRKTRLGPALGVYPRSDPGRLELLDLSAFFDAGLKEGWQDLYQPGDNLSLLPHGLQTLGGVPFDVRGIVQLKSKSLALVQPEYPERVEGIPVGQKCRRLNFLQGAGSTNAEGLTIARYLLHYSDGQRQEAPVRYGQEVLCWHQVKEAPGKALAAAVIAWEGSQARWANQPTNCIRLYHMTWENPRPDVPIETLDFISAMEEAAPFLLAVTIE